MKVSELIELIERGKTEYGKEFLDWSIALEQHPDYRLCGNCNKPEDSILYLDPMVRDEDCQPIKTLFLKSHSMGCCTYFGKEKTLGLQIHY